MPLPCKKDLKKIMNHAVKLEDKGMTKKAALKKAWKDYKKK